MSQPTPTKPAPKFPRQRAKLLELLEEDQKELRTAKQYTTEIFKDCHRRAHEMVKILTDIKEPTIENIGADGSQAVTILALHSYLSLMKKVLKIFERHFRENPENIYYQAIPSLKDRIMILEQKKQLFGTNWTEDKSGTPFLITVEDFSGMNRRREEYGLGPAKRPTNLKQGAVRHPLGQGLTKESDQRKLNSEEYEEYAKYIREPLI